MVIKEGGNVGIGTSSPDEGTLQVKGSLHVENEDDETVFHISSDTEQLVTVGSEAYSEYLEHKYDEGPMGQNSFHFG